MRKCVFGDTLEKKDCLFVSLFQRGFPLTSKLHTHVFENGLTLLAEPMDWLESAAFALLTPAGCQCDPDDRLGLGAFVCEMVQRGCGDRDSRRFVADLELLGADTSASVSNVHTNFGGAVPAENLHATLAIYADVIRRPHFPAEQLEDARRLCLQDIRSLEDDFARQSMQALRRRHYGDPYGRSSQGEWEAVESVSLDQLREYFNNWYGPQDAILSVAGKIDWPRLKDQVEQLFGDWKPQARKPIQEKPPQRGYLHIPNDSQQTHIALAYPCTPYSAPDYYQIRGAVGVLSDGMSSRLFTEVREKRGLCYTVYAFCHSLKDRAAVLSYAATTSERAQETLDVLLAELHRLSEGVRQEELDRLKAKIKSALIMQQESSSSRSSSIAGDWHHLKRVRTIDEVRSAVDGLTCDTVNAHLAEHPPRDFTIVTVGAQELEIA